MDPNATSATTDDAIATTTTTTTESTSTTATTSSKEAPTTSTTISLTSTSSSNPRRRQQQPKRIVRSHIPASILEDPALNSAISSLLPPNYNFEVHKTIHRCLSLRARRVTLQLPDGLLLFSLPLSDLIHRFALVPDPLVLADPSYGACCVDDLSSRALHADLLVHYAHSCLLPLPHTLLPVLYVFVDIRVDVPLLVSTVANNFDPITPLALAGTVQFNSAIHAARADLTKAGYTVTVPQARPLSPGEVLGCTAPRVAPDVEAVVFVADGRFHLEAFMIANPRVRAYRYDPYLGVLFLEEYDHAGMRGARREAIERARRARRWGVVLGTLGRQGSVRLMERVVGRLEEKGMESTVVLMSELSPARLALFGDVVEAWVQVACPRLSIDWGEAFKKPVLTTFELEVALGYVRGWWEKEKVSSSSCAIGDGGKGEAGTMACGTGSCGCSCECGKAGEEEEGDYPMDYYAQDGGEWNSSYLRKDVVPRRREPRVRTGTRSVPS